MGEHLRIGVLDNDACALECIVRMVRSCARGFRRPVDVWSTTFPTEALMLCADATRPTDILLVDMALNGVTGPQLAPEILKRSPSTRLIGLTSYDPQTYAESARQAGIAPLLDKATLARTLAPAIAQAARRRDGTDGDGGVAAADAADIAPRAMAAAMPDSGMLTPQETRIVALSLGSLNAKQIAARLNISADTVFSHRRNIRRKLGVKTWYEALDRCRALHIV
ncbi:LuxR family transcriptional regulator [Bifidobacterium parmae]|uniref:LuxR family transcriptional regulator n=1 Tax=Bifidobacterium parmae TaxID=361854 RepID=A0A2N5IVR5_9BIFI|nr:LuxR family transcriptional regulator [Bifidobacterium parmae]